MKSNRSHPQQRCQNLIGENRTQKVYVLKLRVKVCVLWLPWYFRYNIEAKTSRIHKDGRR